MAEMTDVSTGSHALAAKNQENLAKRILQGFLAVLLALIVVAMVFCGVFYIILKNNVYGLGESFRPIFQDNPVLKLALPETKEEDPDAPENLSDSEIRKKYAEYRQKVADLTAQLEEANRKISEYEEKQGIIDRNQAVLEEDRQVLESIREEQAKLEEQKAEVARLIASGDREGFKEYFSQIDSETAETIYKELVKEDVNEEIKKQLAKPYASMDPASAAKVLSELWKKDQETALGIFEGLNASAKAQILENMEASTAADITRSLSDKLLVK